MNMNPQAHTAEAVNINSIGLNVLGLHNPLMQAVKAREFDRIASCLQQSSDAQKREFDENGLDFKSWAVLNYSEAEFERFCNILKEHYIEVSIKGSGCMIDCGCRVQSQ